MAVDARVAYQQAENAIQAMNERIMLQGGMVVNREKALEAKAAAGAGCRRAPQRD